MSRRLGVAALVALVLLSPFVPVDAAGGVEAVIADRAAAHGVSAERMTRVAVCESSLDPWAVGDHGTSFGLFQLNSRSTGLLSHFYAAGYADPFDAWEASDYYARVLSGEFADEYVTWRRWSCT